MKEGGKRKLTPFLAHQMLFDFVTDQLDQDRKAAVEEFVKSDRESQNIIEAIRRGVLYAGSLKRIELSPEFLSELEQSENFVSLSRKWARWSQWPDSLRWSLMALFISVCTAGVVMVIPWQSLPIFKTSPGLESGSFEIARLEGRKAGGDHGQLAPDTSEEATDAISGPLEGSGDEEFAEESSGARPTIQAPVSAAVVKPAASVSALPLPRPSPAISLAKTATPSPVAIAAQPAATPLAKSALPVKPVASSPQVSEVSASKSSRGYVYRAFMTLSDLENIAPKITQQLKELGAEKAGEVELGWLRGSGRYYHFSLPEMNEQKLMETLRGYGPVRISKDPHPRVMPQGQLRFILWIESGV